VSKIYKKKNKESSKLLFEKRQIYRYDMNVQNQKHIVDFFRAEKILYGRISPDFQPIAVKPARLVTMPGPEPRQIIMMADFVADMYKRLSGVFQKSIISGQISKNEPYLSNLVAYKGYEDPMLKYENYRLIYYKAIAQRFRQHNIKVRDFDHFMENLFKVVGNAFSDQPLTYCGFIKSTQCSTMMTGLAIEIADLKYQDDSTKISQFVQSKNWDFYVNACNAFGFMVDLNVPWRIVADLQSTAMKEAAARYGNSYFLGDGFNTAIGQYLPVFISEMHRLYQVVKLNSFIEHVQCSDGTTKPKKIIPETYRYGDLKIKYGGRYFLKYYLQIRLKEERPDMPTEQNKQMVKAYLDTTVSSRPLEQIARSFESIINKTFDKTGSASYLIKSEQAQREKSFDRGETNTIEVTTGDFSSY